MAYIGLLTYIFFFFIRMQDWWGPIKGVPVDYIVISFTVVLLVFSNTKFNELLKMPQLKLLFLLLIAIILSNLVNGNIDASIEYGIKYLKYIIIFILIVLSVNSYFKLKFLALFILALIIFISFQCMVQVETGTNVAGQSLYWADRARWVGIFDGSNITALALVLVIPFLLEFFFGPWGKGYKLVSMISAYFIF